MKVSVDMDGMDEGIQDKIFKAMPHLRLGLRQAINVIEVIIFRTPPASVSVEVTITIAVSTTEKVKEVVIIPKLDGDIATLITPIVRTAKTIIEKQYEKASRALKRIELAMI